ncbi:STAS domain-containing protein [Anaerostipes sp. MSJ-23]|uniref:STAS domain-containing protein n=1 Tax=unclassified Anaerostipes TaxID=2635253 RepID=UPI001C10CD60|nr:anti-sigma factor antagonist [Anaerostipes sp. MSJ-23]MBU5459069.1 anti-sigma factor antagonist [Anaerostipes sp. MSJ-23]
MATEYQVENRVLHIRLDGELDHHLAQKVRYQCDVILKSYPIRDIEFDFSNSEFMDSSGVGMILGRYRQVQPMGGSVIVSHMNKNIRRIVHMAGLHQVVKEK